MEYYKDLCPNSFPYEQWRAISGFEGKYEVSSFARVKSIGRCIPYTNFNGKEVKSSYRTIIMRQYESSGYLKVDLYDNLKRKRMFVHILVATAFIPNPENKKTVNHKKGIRKLNLPDELEWATYSENNKHAREVLRK